MDYFKNKMTNEKQKLMESELKDLGSVSVETKGSFLGGSWDGGFGTRKP
jgi:hypothetical protein